MRTPSHPPRKLWMPLIALLLGGCVSGIPETIRTAPPAGPGLLEVRQQPDAFIGRPIRWGGKILKVGNKAGTTEIELLALPLDIFGEPRRGPKALGRFVAEYPGFRDPAEYPEGRSLTVYGTLARVEDRRIGDYPYSYPVVAVASEYLWAEPPQVVFVPYGDPWYGPWPGPRAPRHPPPPRPPRPGGPPR